MAKDYSLIGQSAKRAKESGLANPQWYRTKVDPELIKKLRVKSDTIALRDTVLWLGLMVLSAIGGIFYWGSWLCVPFWFVYGVLYGSASDSRWHECGHQTAFKTKWMNDGVYQLASFMLMRNPVVWRASHVRHHTDTIIVGRDPEIVAMRPPDLIRIFINLFGLIDARMLIKRMFLHATGKLHLDEADYLSSSDERKVFLVARIWLVIYAITIVAALWFSSFIPLMLIGLPRLYGAWHHVFTGLLQHLGLAENVTDHRLNTRTVLMNPISRFLYLNMNYHLEHHMFTMVPYYHLPRLHEAIKHDVPPPEPSIFAAFKRLLPVLKKQLKYEDAVIIPILPKGATPYSNEVEALLPHAS